jgi:hypothetical protein
MKEDLAWKPDQPLQITNVTELIVNGVCQVRNHIDHHQKFRGDDESRKRESSVDRRRARCSCSSLKSIRI